MECLSNLDVTNTMRCGQHVARYKMYWKYITGGYKRIFFNKSTYLLRISFSFPLQYVCIVYKFVCTYKRMYKHMYECTYKRMYERMYKRTYKHINKFVTKKIRRKT